VATLTGKNIFHGMGIICVSDKPLHGHYGNVSGINERNWLVLFAENVASKYFHTVNQLKASWIN
jgi:hypothetical protein